MTSVADPAPPSEGLRERQRRRTRADISRAAVDLVCERGVANVTVDEIAAAAGVSPRTFFNYFPAKTDALLTWVPVVGGQELDRFVGATDGPLLDGLRELLLEVARGVEAQQEEAGRVREVLRASPELRPLLHARFRAFEASLSEAIAARTGQEASMRPRVVAAVVAATFRAAFAEWTDPDHARGRSVGFTTLLREAFAVLESLVPPEPQGQAQPEPRTRPGQGSGSNR